MEARAASAEVKVLLTKLHVKGQIWGKKEAKVRPNAGWEGVAASGSRRSIH